MRKKARVGVVKKIDDNSITVEIKQSTLPNMTNATKNYLTSSRVSMYKQSPYKKRGLLGIKYKPTYFVGKTQLRGNQRNLITVGMISDSSLKVGDSVIILPDDTKKK